MAAPNLLALTTMTAKSVTASLTVTTTTSLLSNASSSGKLLRIDSVIVGNSDGTNSTTITLGVNKAAGGQKSWSKVVSLAAGTTIIISDKNTPIYLEENDTFEGGAANASRADITINYVELS